MERAVTTPSPLAAGRSLRNRLFLYFGCYLLMLAGGLYALSLVPSRLEWNAPAWIMGVGVASLAFFWMTIAVLLMLRVVCPRCGTSMFLSGQGGMRIWSLMLAEECTHCNLDLRKSFP